MPYHEHDFADMLFAWPAAEGRIIHLYELDPTHMTTQDCSNVSPRTSHTVQPSRAAEPYCALTEIAPAAVLLELDPTHTYAR